MTVWRAWFTCALLLLHAAPAMAWEARVVGVTDGDTLTIEDEFGERDRVRLWGIDAPERDQPGGEPARAHCAAVALWQDVDVQEVARDKYARLLAVLVRPGRNGRPDWSINGNMVRMGHAWAYGGRRWKGTEERARMEHRGFWKDEQPIPPWEWRKIRK